MYGVYFCFAIPIQWGFDSRSSLVAGRGRVWRGTEIGLAILGLANPIVVNERFTVEILAQETDF
jgi:hypothetical protein